MAAVSCPKCNTLVQKAGYPAWVIIVAICFFPLGLLALRDASLRDVEIADSSGKAKRRTTQAHAIRRRLRAIRSRT